MPGLIPLMLGSSNRLSLLPSPPNSPHELRRQSTSNTDSSSWKTSNPRRQSTANTDSWQSRQMSRPKPLKRLSLPTPAPLPMVPYSPAEWKKAIAEIKRDSLAEKHRACSARCVEILNGIKDKSQVEPVYLIHLHFYAATSMEICARPLPASSAFRTNLLKQARTHFDRAAALINAAEESVITKVRPGSVTSSRGSSCHSPSGSISSRADTPDTRVSSPTDSVSSFDDLSSRLGSPKRVKKVSFSLPQEETIRIPEPYIRPDSPTLGFDDMYFHSPITKQHLPEPPVSPKFQEIEYPLHTIHESDESDHTFSSEEEDESAYMVAQSIDRCCEHLSGLRRQLSRHAASLSETLSKPSSSAVAAVARSRSGKTVEELKALDKLARIERLRRNGWQRQRFDARRYEELCEAVLAELS
ncbi:hypothetical protein QBC35DRAFT_516862 [Podospora australis]|uniref:Uncharacterized protein n=1 Tax=Podospora australis TaxID=1536484 RepID=A0AAN6WQC9_9PEZI|nr:hypothetical protein QBC35DRAFT_516862 [Podospora australis]